jgi:hypothetical protein
MNMIDLVRKPNSSRFLVVGLSLLTLVLLAATAHPMLAQTNSTVSATGPAAADPGSDQEKQAAKAASAPQAAPSEGFKLGAYDVRSEFEVGYRWSSGIGGNEQMYRSQVNLYSGAQLLNSYLSLRSTPGTGLFDRMEVSLNNWGDPYNAVRFSMGRMDLYDFKASYRNMRYYNWISTLDNPLLSTGFMLPQHYLDINYRMSNFDLRLFPNHKIVPYVGYAHNSAVGPGLTTMGTTGNEFVLNTNWVTATDEFRGGVQFNLSRLNLTLEQGYRYSKNDTGVTNIPGSFGNEGVNSYLGQNITLDSLGRSYYSRTKLPTSKVLAKFAPFKQLRMTGRYIYSMGTTESDLTENRSGGFVNLDPITYLAAADDFSGRATRPNHNGSFLIEFTPGSHFTLTDTVDTLDYHVSGAGMLSTTYMNASSLFGPGPKTNMTVKDTLNTMFAYNEVRNQAEVEYEIGYGFSARAGHRYQYMEVTTDDSEDIATSNVSRGTGLVGMVYRPGKWLRFGLDFEETRSNQVMTRIDQYDYYQVNMDWRIGSWNGLSFNGRIGLRSNKNAVPDIDLKAHDQNYSGTISYEPNDRISISADLSRTNLLSDLLIIVPQTLSSERSVFDQRVMGIGSRVALTIYKGFKTEFGYRGIFNKGSYPLEFHQPYASLWIPIAHGLAFKPTWQYYGYHQSLYGFENYQTHLVTFALVFSR